MLSRKASIVLVCLLFLIAVITAQGSAYTIRQAAAPAAAEELLAPESPTQTKVAKFSGPARLGTNRMGPKRIVKCRPSANQFHGFKSPFGPKSRAVLPFIGSKRWEMSAEVMFARTKGTVRHIAGSNATASYRGIYDVDLNSDLGVPDHWVVPTYSARYRFKPKWSIRYQIMPIEMGGSGSPGRDIAFGTSTRYGGAGWQNLRVKWERQYHRIGLVYDTIRTYRARISVVGDYVRVDDKLTVIQPGCCGDIFNSDLNMGMAGLEFETALRTGRWWNTLSLECSAGVAFGDEAFGSDVSTGLKYRIYLNGGRWGYLRGGYRYLTYNKNYSDAKQWSTVIEGGYLQMGFIF